MSGIVGARGQIYKIIEIPNEILNGVEVGYKIGDGDTVLNQLPWELYEEIKTIIDNKFGSSEYKSQIQDLSKQTTLNLLKNDSETKQILNIQTNRYIGSLTGTSQINGIISRYLINNDVGDDLEDGVIINCN